MNGSTYTDFLLFQDAQTRYEESTRLLIIDKTVEPGTPEYKELVNIRIQAKRDLTGVSNYTTPSDSNRSARQDLAYEQSNN